MPAKKTASRKRKGAAHSRKKAASRRPAARSKPAAKKRKVTKKKSSAKKSTKKKTVARKKPATKKKAGKKKVSRKKPASKKKVTAKKRAKKKVAGKKVSKKKVARKKPAAKKSAGRKTTTRKPAARKSPAKKKASTRKATARKAPARRRKVRSDILTSPIHGIDPYVAAGGEDYMGPQQLKHFLTILSAWKSELMTEVDRTVHHMQDEAANFPDPNDRATQESEFGLELRTRDRERKLLRKISSAMARIDDGTYGYCEETGEEIGLKRLEARPVATLCVEAQERREVAERQFRDRDDRYR